MKDLNERICIIGGGPAGLAAGMYLEKKGYTNYQILEKDGEVGGKCHSPHYASKADGSDVRRFEEGAIMGCDSYFAVREAEIFGGSSHEGGPELIREYKNAQGKLIYPFEPKKNIFAIPMLLKMKKQVKRLGELLETKYQGYDVTGHRGLASGKFDGPSPATPEMKTIQGENPNLKDLMLPFKDFCALNKVELVQKIWIGPFTAFGYGYFDEIPAAYVLKYLDFHTLIEFINGRLWTWKEGTQSIWEGVDAHLKNHARLNCNITKVERKDGKVYVTVGGKVEEYDDVIITAPLQFMPQYFDATQEEKDLFAKIHHEPYDVLTTRIEDNQWPPKSAYVFDNMTTERLGHLMIYYHRWDDIKEQVVTTYALRAHKNMNDIPYDECKKTVLDDMKTANVPVKEIITEHDWYYFPHIFTEDYQTGWYDKVEAMQGQLHTYYAGEIMCFGDMEETAEYSRDLVNRFF